MFLPGRPRHKKTQICRTRNGCHTCRRRHRKCDETKPGCQQCARLGVDCEGYSIRLKWRKTSTDGSSEHARNTSEPLWSASLSAPIPESASVRKSHSTVRRFADPGSKPPLKRRSVDTTRTPNMPLEILGSGQEYNYTRHRDLMMKMKMASSLSSSPSLLGVDAWVLREDEELSFLHHFQSHVNKGLGLSRAVQHGLSQLWYHPYLRTAVLALSASSLFHLYSAQHSPDRILENMYRPIAKRYLRHAVTYYDKAVTSLSGDCVHESEYFCLKLAKILMLALFEWGSGSVGAYFAHMNGADALVLTSHEQISRTSSGAALLRTWADMRAQKNRHKLSFRPLDVEFVSQQEQALQRVLADSGDDTHLSTLVTTAYRLRCRVVSQTFMAMDGHDEESVIRACRSWYSRAFHFNYDEEPETRGCRILGRDEVMSRLATTNRLLREWRESLPASESPFNERASDPRLGNPRGPNRPGDLLVTPLVFHDHDAAVQYLEYAIGCVLSSHEILRPCLFESPSVSRFAS